jgi:CHASE2 domain-containing sensor protein
VADDPDPLVEELLRARRDRRPVLVGAAIGIVLGVTFGMASFLGALGSAVEGEQARNHAAIVYFVAPLAIGLGLGYAVYGVRRRRR